MANKIILKKTSTASKVPLSTDLEVGEIAVNLADQKLYSKNASGTVILVGDGQGTGDVTGGSSSTDNALARYDGTTGKVIQNSAVIVDDTGSVTGVNALTAESLVVNNDATIGSSNTDTLDVRSRISSDLDPETNNAKDIGSSGRNWRDGFFGRTLHTVNLEVTGTTQFDGSQGTSGQVLTSAGTGNTPTWTTPTTGTVTSVGGTGTVNGISLSGTVTSSGDLTLGGTLSGVSLSTQVTDTLPISNGGTGQTTANAGLNALLPSQTGNSGKVLSTDGTNTTWSSAGAGSGTVTSVTGGAFLTGGTITTSGTLAVDATSANTASKVVARDASGNFSAGTITASLSGNASTSSRVTGGNLNPASTAFNNSIASASGSNRVVAFDGNGQQPSVWWTNGGTAIGAIDGNSGGGLQFWSNNGSSWQQQATMGYGTFNVLTTLQQGGSNVITAGNIGSQSVSYASSAGSATYWGNTNFPTGNNQNFNNVLTGGVYNIVWGNYSGTLNTPPANNSYGVMEVLQGNNFITQVYYPHNGNSSPWMRIYYNGSWSSWINSITSANIGSQTVAQVSNSKMDTTSGAYTNFYTWMQLHGHYGLYSTINNAHFFPNQNSYGSWRCIGTRNGWGGIEFDGSTTAVSLMIESNGDTVGWHANSYGWKFRVQGGNAYVSKSYWGGGADALVQDTVNSGRCVAWVNFDGTNASGFNASFNVSSVVRTSTGIFTISFSSGIGDTNYTLSGSGASGGLSGVVLQATSAGAAPTLKTTTQCAIRTAGTGGNVNMLSTSAVFHR